MIFLAAPGRPAGWRLRSTSGAPCAFEFEDACARGVREQAQPTVPVNCTAQGSAIAIGITARGLGMRNAGGGLTYFVLRFWLTVMLGGIIMRLTEQRPLGRFGIFDHIKDGPPLETISNHDFHSAIHGISSSTHLQTTCPSVTQDAMHYSTLRIKDAGGGVMFTGQKYVMIIQPYSHPASNGRCVTPSTPSLRGPWRTWRRRRSPPGPASPRSPQKAFRWLGHSDHLQGHSSPPMNIPARTWCSSHHHLVIILAPSSSHHRRIIVASSSHHRPIIVPSSSHHRPIMVPSLAWNPCPLLSAVVPATSCVP